MTINLFFDTEFSTLDEEKMQLISIGIVDETGTKRFYAELADTYRLDDCHPWTRENVIPLLEGANKPEVVLYKSELRFKLYDYFAQWPEDEEIFLWSDVHHWDWIHVLRLFGSPATNLEGWPPNLIPQERVLSYVGDDAVRFSETQKLARTVELESFREKHIGEHRKLVHHHALDDALANWLGWLRNEKRFKTSEGTLSSSPFGSPNTAEKIADEVLLLCLRGKK